MFFLGVSNLILVVVLDKGCRMVLCGGRVECILIDRCYLDCEVRGLFFS